MENNIYDDEINNNPNNINNNDIIYTQNNESLAHQNNNRYTIKNIFKLFPGITISFLVFFIINIIIYIYSKLFQIETEKYIFQYAPIIQKFQYYRIITRYFIHHGVFHLIIELYSLFYLCKCIENNMGTLLTLSLFCISMIVISFFQLFCLIIFTNICKGRIVTLTYYSYEGGLTPTLFTILTFYCLFFKERNDELNLDTFINLKVKYSYLYILAILYFFTPNKTFFANVSGIIVGRILKNHPKYFLPRLIWIKQIEDYYKLDEINILYRRINLNNNKMKEILKEYDSESVDEILGKSKIHEKNKINKLDNDDANNNSDNSY